MGKRYTIPAGMPIANWTPEAVKKYIIPNQTPTLPILPNTNQARIPTDVREENGALNIFGGAVFTGIGAIALYTVLGVACPPALLIAGVAASSGAIVYGSSMFMEGVDEISLAQQGDTVTKAFNPIRDTIFDGNQGDYDLFGAISTAGSIVSAQAASGYAGDASGAENSDSKKYASLRDNGDGTWTSKAGLEYGQGSVDGNRVEHVLQHTVPNVQKAKHTVFNVDKSDVFDLIDEAWTSRGSGVLQANGNVCYDVDMGRVIGTDGETVIRIITDGFSNQIVTAFPRG